MTCDFVFKLCNFHFSSSHIFDNKQKSSSYSPEKNKKLTHEKKKKKKAFKNTNNDAFVPTSDKWDEMTVWDFFKKETTIIIWPRNIKNEKNLFNSQHIHSHKSDARKQNFVYLSYEIWMELNKTKFFLDTFFLLKNYDVVFYDY